VRGSLSETRPTLYFVDSRKTTASGREKEIIGVGKQHWLIENMDAAKNLS